MLYQPPPDLPLPLLHVDDSLIVVDKPPGLLSVPGRGEDKQDCLIHRLQRHFPDARIVHRLDMATSGLLVIARGDAMQAALSALFRERKVSKRYVAIVANRPECNQGEVDLPLICDWPNRPRQKVDHEIGKRSLTRYRLLFHDISRVVSWVELEPVTGRSHQLRVHMAALGCPILGDELYGPETLRDAQRLMLHAREIAFPHPLTGQILQVSAPAPFGDAPQETAKSV